MRIRVQLFTLMRIRIQIQLPKTMRIRNYASDAHFTHSLTHLLFTQIDEEHRSMTGVIGQSKKLITKYMRREFTDKVRLL